MTAKRSALVKWNTVHHTSGDQVAASNGSLLFKFFDAPLALPPPLPLKVGVTLRGTTGSGEASSAAWQLL
jgi:hypothetical protein